MSALRAIETQLFRVVVKDYLPGRGLGKWFDRRLRSLCGCSLDVIVFAWMRLKSGSLWTAVFLHASHNLFVQVFFDSLTVDRGPAKYVTSEFGAGLASVCLLLAIYFWTRRAEVQPAPQS